MRPSPSILLAVLLAACVRVPDPVFEPADASASTSDGLARVDQSGFRRGWIRPGSWARDYHAIVGRFEGIVYRGPPRQAADAPPGREGYALPDGMQGEWMNLLAEAFIEALGDAGELRLAQGAGPGVLRARFVLRDLVVHAPLARLADQDAIWIDSAGELSVEIELRDSVSDERLALFAEREYLAREGFGGIRATPGPVTYEALRIFRRWSRNLALVIGALRRAAST